MKKIALINGHPNNESFNFALAEAYKKGAENSGAEIKEIIIRDLDFNPNLQFGYQKRMELESDLIKAWEIIQWADHLVWIHPVWWGGLPLWMHGKDYNHGTGHGVGSFMNVHEGPQNIRKDMNPQELLVGML
jgi:putative NADPH-quinone reductase